MFFNVRSGFIFHLSFPPCVCVGGGVFRQLWINKCDIFSHKSSKLWLGGLSFNFVTLSCLNFRINVFIQDDFFIMRSWREVLYHTCLQFWQNQTNSASSERFWVDICSSVQNWFKSYFWLDFIDLICFSVNVLCSLCLKALHWPKLNLFKSFCCLVFVQKKLIWWGRKQVQLQYLFYLSMDLSVTDTELWARL